MKVLVVGGDFNRDGGRSSGLINKFSDFFQGRDGIDHIEVVNGGTMSDLPAVVDADLVIWAPNIPNEEEKHYPKKKAGSVLICSKVMREGGSIGDAVARIFKMHANAVISISSVGPLFKLNLVDALGNKWSDSADISKTVDAIMELYAWTEKSIRWNSKGGEIPELDSAPPLSDADHERLNKLCATVHKLADKVENERGGRYFGNVSTRCAKMFPSLRLPDNIILMSARNVPKDRISTNDFVFTKLVDSTVLFLGEKKPSVDSPIQLSLYRNYKHINFLVHGHAYIRGAKYTDNYFPCGDMREYYELNRVLSAGDITAFALNLRSHGFVIGAETLEELGKLVDALEFDYRTPNLPVELETLDVNKILQ